MCGYAYVRNSRSRVYFLLSISDIGDKNKQRHVPIRKWSRFYIYTHTLSMKALIQFYNSYKTYKTTTF